MTAKLATAYPLGRVVIGLIARGHTELGDVLMARLVKKCFWITGYFPPRRPVRPNCLSLNFILKIPTHRTKRTNNIKKYSATPHQRSPSPSHNTPPAKPVS